MLPSSTPLVTQPQNFGPCLLWPNGWMDQDVTWNGGKPWPRQHCVKCGPSSTPGGTATPTTFGPCLLWPNGWMDQDVTWYEGRPRSRPHCITQGPSAPTPSPQKGGTIPSNFRSVSIVAKLSPISAPAEHLLWSPYVIGQTIIFSSCCLFFFFFFLLSFFLA